ncbi:uncharacterized protein [Euwallacea fornicatus]|uniref:uncharacterized protein n=1 Tax=Euwallacea fornicatus TaxID=995702 RepID=UPI00338E9C03
MVAFKGVILLTVIHIFASQVICVKKNRSLLLRKKRYVTFPEGASFSAVICLTSQMGITDGATIFSEGINWGLVYDLPNQTAPFLDYFAPAQKRRNRRELYRKVEDILSSMGYNGRQCILRSLCEASRMFKKREDSLLYHILSVIFTFPKEPILPHEHDDHKIYNWASLIGEEDDPRDERGVEDKCVDFFQCPFSLVQMALGYYSNINNDAYYDVINETRN